MQQAKFSIIFLSPLGPIRISLYRNQLAGLKFLEISSSDKFENHSDYLKNATPFVQQIVHELRHYFDHAKHVFNLALYIEGTLFQQRVWKALQKIPSGETLTYGELARQLQTSPRAIGQACRTNRIPIIIPCHRIIATHHIGGYAGNITGHFAKIKEQLLLHEQSD
ncbi:MAG TPA: methylated-DNA--[protein]-cysteine S-methyltransferase [Gammaproteobacteria bacterium]|nr:methylated-DNA--[protein]-cysteine S-methyltransferase [Gammaproteobacteria bacterium]